MPIAPPPPELGLPEGSTLVRRQPWPEAQARVDEIVAAFYRFEAETKVADDAAGLTAIRDAEDAAAEREQALRKQIAALPATILAGVRLKAEVIADVYEAEGIAAKVWDGLEGTMPAESMVWVIVRDLLAMAASA